MRTPLALGVASLLIGALTSGLLSSGEAHAAAFDPALTWRTMVTEHFHITFHGEEEALAEEVAGVLEQVYVEMTAELAHTPHRRTEVVLVDNTDSANGFAMTLPVNTIVIYVTAPSEDGTLSRYEQWSDAILTHEFTHILHLDTVEGLPKLARQIVGRIISTNSVSPGWVVEGFATYQETRHTNEGRGRSAYVDMIKRMSVLEDNFPPLGNMDGWQREAPGGNLRYLYGQDFIQYVADARGSQVWTDWAHVYGGWVPYWLPTHRVFGRRLVPLYREWEAALEARYQAQAARLEARGLTPFRVLSDGEDQCAGPTFSPDGQRIVWSCYDQKDGSGIYLANGAGEEAEVETRQRYATEFGWRGDSKAYAYAALHTVNRFNLYYDVYLHKIDGGDESLTRGARARDPTFSPDGRELLVVTNAVQENELARLTVDRRLDPIVSEGDHVQLATPHFSPDGELLALSRWQDGQRDIWLYTREGQPLRRLTIDLASDIDPSWSADGRTLYFSSDRSGIFNIYAIDLETEHLRQITNVLGGAFHPSVRVDGAALVFESFSDNGMDIAWMDLSPESGWDLGQLPLPLAERGPDLASLIPTDLSPPVYKEPEAPKEDDGKKHKGKRHKDKPPSQPGTALDLPYPGLDGIGGALLAMPRELRIARPGTRTQPEAGPDEPEASAQVEDLTTVDTSRPEIDDYPFTHPVRRYNPIPTLLPPRYVVPLIYQTAYGFQGTLATGGVDTLRRYAYSASLSYRTDARFVGWGVGAVWNQWVPVFSAGVYATVTPYGDIYAYPGPPSEGGAWVPSVQSVNRRYWDKRVNGYLQVSHDLGDYQSVFARWTGQSRDPKDPLPADTYTPALPTRGFLSAVGGGWRYARGRSYTDSISPEDARIISLVGQVAAPWLGSFTLDDNNQSQGFTQLQLTAEWREYRPMPWAHNHVLAWKLAGGGGMGDSQRYGNYRLGGSYGEAAYYTLPDEWRALRGFPPATVYGDWYYLGSLEYRLPLLYVDRGWGTIPFFLRTFSAAVFADAGNAFSDPGSQPAADLFGATRVGVGAELRVTTILGWGIPLNLRLGYAFAAYGDGGFSPGSLDGLYLWLGSSF